MTVEPSQMLQVLVFIKQVPDTTSSKAGVNADGTINRAQAKRMLNPFDRFALQGALRVKEKYGAKVTAITMGPPPAEEILLEAIGHGADKGILLSDRRLAASDTLATSYALWKVAQYLGHFDLIFCGLQTTDGDTAQVGPEIAERFQVPHISYCEKFEVEGHDLVAQRIIEGGFQRIRTPLPALITVANSAEALKYQSIHGAKHVQALGRDAELKKGSVEVITLDTIGADPMLCGLKGSPTIVGKTWKIGDIGGSCTVYEGIPVEHMVQHSFQTSNVLQFANL
ncbi:MAG: electron transfer flavoprotein subunit beta/FixA family protein [Vampirovibrionales bacterium]